MEKPPRRNRQGGFLLKEVVGSMLFVEVHFAKFGKSGKEARRTVRLQKAEYRYDLVDALRDSPAGDGDGRRACCARVVDRLVNSRAHMDPAAIGKCFHPDTTWDSKFARPHALQQNFKPPLAVGVNEVCKVALYPPVKFEFHVLIRLEEAVVAEIARREIWRSCFGRYNMTRTVEIKVRRQGDFRLQIDLHNTYWFEVCSLGNPFSGGSPVSRCFGVQTRFLRLGLFVC